MNGDENWKLDVLMVLLDIRDELIRQNIILAEKSREVPEKLVETN